MLRDFFFGGGASLFSDLLFVGCFFFFFPYQLLNSSYTSHVPCFHMQRLFFCRSAKMKF